MEAMMPSLLVVDDDPQVLMSLENSLQSDEIALITAQTGKQGIDLVSKKQPSAVILDVRLPDMSGLDTFDRIRQIDSRLPVIVITAYATTETAIEAMKRGAFEYLLKPVDLHQLREVVTKAIELSRLRHVPAIYDDAERIDGTVDRIVGHSPAMQEVYKAIGRAAPLDVNVLVLGESGTGKELVTRAIYHHSKFSEAPFLVIDCAAVPESLLESELFGHERGAFTSADTRRIGKFEQAANGTIFLDEIGDLALPTQAKLLRLLQEQRFNRVGGNEVVETRARLIAATNHNLEVAVEAGRFRRDLYYRLKVFTIQLPPLRDRLDDVPLLVSYFLDRFNREFDKHVRSASAETLQLLNSHVWPGNVRELQNAIKFAMVLTTGEQLTPDCLPENLRDLTSIGGRKHRLPDTEALDLGQLVRDMLRSGQPDIYREVCAAVDRFVLTAVLNHVSGNQVQAAELLGISRTTLRTKLQSLDLFEEK
jgi:two-component system nitrogen regulation response regulator GlnG